MRDDPRPPTGGEPSAPLDAPPQRPRHPAGGVDFRLLLDSMDEGFIALDPEFRITEINAEGLRIDGRPREEILGRPLLAVWPEAADLPTWPLYQQAMADRQPRRLEYRHLSDVHDVWLEVRVYPAEPGLAVFYRDITERRRDADALVEGARARDTLRSRQEAILGQLEEGVIVADAAGRITFVNDAAARLHGVKALDVEPDDYTETYHLLTEDGRPHPVEDLPLARAVRRGETVTDARWRIRRPDGTVVVAIGSAKPLVVDGAIAGAVLTVRDDTARSASETAMRTAEERLRYATRATNDAIWDWTFADGRIHWNEALREAYGHAPEGGETGADWWLGQIHPDDRTRVGDGIHAVIEGDGTAWTDEYRFRRADGAYADVLDRGTVIRDTDGRAQRMIGAMLDLTERKRAEAAVREGERRYRTLFEAIEVGFCVIELKFDGQGRPVDYRIAEANPAFEQHTGLAGAQGRWVRELLPTLEEHWFEIYGRVARTGTPERFENSALPLGRAFDVYAFRVDGLEPNRVGVLFSDITERKRSEEALRQSEERLRLATDAAEIGLWDVDPVAETLIWPPRVKAMFGIPADASVTMDDFYAGLHPDDAPAMAEAFAAAVDPDRRALYDVEYRTVGREDGAVRWVAAKGRGLFDAGGRCIRVVGTAIDITERKLTLEALREKDATIKAFYETSNLYTAVLELDADDYCFVTANRETARFYGVDDLSGHRGSEFMDALALPRMMAALRAGHEAGRATTLEYPFKVDERTRWFLATLAPMPTGASGRPRISVASFDITDRKRAESALRASEERLAGITDSVDQMIWATRPDGFHDYYNQRWYDYTGVPEGSTDGEAWNGMFHPEDQPRAWERWDHSLRTGEPYEIEYRLRHRSGQYRWVIGRARAVRDAGGAITRWYGTCTDIHDLKTAQAGLEEERRTLETINRTGAALSGELEPERLIQMVTDAGRELTGAEYAAFFHSSTVGENDFGLYTLSGARREEFEHLGRPQITALFHGTFVDKQVVRSDDVLSDPRYGTMRPHSGLPAKHLPVRSYLAVPVIGRAGEVIGAILFGHGEPGRFNGRHERLVVGVAAQAAIAIDNARLLQSAQTELTERRRAEAALRDLNATLEARIAEAIADREQVEAALRQAQKMEAVGQLTGGIAHDFNNLLTVVMGNIDMGRRALDAGEEGGSRIRRALDNAQRGAERAAALTQRLLAFARRQPLLPKAINVDRLVAGMQDLLARALGETVRLEVVTAPGLWRVEADPNQLESAILNLAVNARDAMPGGGRLTVETANANLEDAYSAAHAEVAPGQYVVIAISDTGEGMSRETLEHVFEPFFTTKEVGKGTGLGLSQVYGFVKQSGGHVKIYSEVGQGTTVKIYLPRRLGGEDADEEGAPRDAEPAAARETVLVVEDDADVRQYSSESLRELGYRVLEAEDGPTALRVLERAASPVDLLFTDVVMPAMSGRELADAARERRPGIRVLFTSGYTRNAITRDGRLEPGTAMIAKPFTFSALARKLRDVLDTGKSGRVLMVSSDAPPRGAAALDTAGYAVDVSATAGEALGRVRAEAAMFDAVVVTVDGDARSAMRLYAELRGLRDDLPILLLAGEPDEIGGRIREDRCADVSAAAEEIDLSAALARLGVRCAEAHAQAGNIS